MERDPDHDPHLIVRTEDAVRWLVLNRPEQRNAVSPEMVCRLADAWRDAEADDSVRVVVLAARGPTFSAGADLKLLVPLLSGDRRPEDGWDERLVGEPELGDVAFGRTPACSKPVIAAVNGPATGGGFELLLTTPLRIAAASARFGLTEVKLGLIPGGGGVARLPRQIPVTLALEMLLTGELMDARRAASIGLVNAVVPDDELDDRVRTMARSIAANGPLATRLILGVARDAEREPLDTALRLEAEAFRTALASEDGREGPRAFAEKRAPRFVGR